MSAKNNTSDVLAETARRLKEQRQAVGQAPAASAPGDGKRTSRSTVDLPMGHHMRLNLWQAETADKFHVARIARQEVLAALVAVMLDDPAVERKVLDRITKDRPGLGRT